MKIMDLYLIFLTAQINITEIKTNVFIAGIGYILWDTVYMINLCLQQLSQLMDEDEYINRLVMLKFNRYIKKYILFLKALDNPANYLNCSPLHNFIQDCIKREETESDEAYFKSIE